MESKNFTFKKEEALSQEEVSHETPDKQEKPDSERTERKSFSTFIAPQFDFKNILANFRHKQNSSVGTEAKVEKNKMLSMLTKGKKMNQVGTEKSENIDP